ncbi:MAG: bifunctional enoyl-CoA hydratase/phosphate acetyltransferase [candidate division KSB1 bacterium]|nr:bifunctional enoyl-CoA hydratase/phosphate acetyltransferase [candidate division KSB1 bacterium]
MIETLDQLLEEAKAISRKSSRPIKVVIAAAQDKAALSALIEARQMGLADGILIGDKTAIRELLKATGSESFEIIHELEEKEIGRQAMLAIREGRADVVVKGNIKTSSLFKAVLDPEYGLRTGRLISDVFIFEFPQRQGNKLIMITDGGVTLAPDLQQKIQILENAVSVAHALGNPCPKVALVSATEVVIPELPSTVDAAIIAKMNQRGQIKGCLVDGPLGLDNAVSLEAAREKGIESPVAGQADILVCPNIESANLMAKGTTYFAGLRLAHVCVGAKAPVLIPSRTDSAEAKLLSIALSIVVSAHKI